jgi:hypothetical protein
MWSCSNLMVYPPVREEGWWPHLVQMLVRVLRRLSVAPSSWSRSWGWWRLIAFRSHRATFPSSPLVRQPDFTETLGVETGVEFRHILPDRPVKFVRVSHRTTPPPPHPSLQLAPHHFRTTLLHLPSSLHSLHHRPCKHPADTSGLYCLRSSAWCRTTQSSPPTIDAACQAHWRRIHRHQPATFPLNQPATRGSEPSCPDVAATRRRILR